MVSIVFVINCPRYSSYSVAISTANEDSCSKRRKCLLIVIKVGNCYPSIVTVERLHDAHFLFILSILGVTLQVTKKRHVGFGRVGGIPLGSYSICGNRNYPEVGKIRYVARVTVELVFVLDLLMDFLQVVKDLSNMALGPSPFPNLAHVVIGFESCGYRDEDFVAFCVLSARLQLLNHILLSGLSLNVV
uniref:Uncharacterized protein n=1 Tax=Parascaris equorum TaxID=6256 RepID=A0A914RMZ3_PAREQ